MKRGHRKDADAAITMMTIVETDVAFRMGTAFWKGDFVELTAKYEEVETSRTCATPGECNGCCMVRATTTNTGRPSIRALAMQKIPVLIEFTYNDILLNTY